MNEFNGKQYYGYSALNDPALATTTNNFEFRYMRPEYLERVIQRVRKEQNIAEKQKSQLERNSYPHHDITTIYGPASGLQHKDIVAKSHEKKDTQFVRDLSKEEIENLIRKAKTYAATSPGTSKIPQQSPKDGNKMACTHNSLEFREGHHCTTIKESIIQGTSSINTQNLQSLREENKLAFENVSLAFNEGQHSLNTTRESERIPITTSPLRSTPGKCKGISRQFSQEEFPFNQWQSEQYTPIINSPQSRPNNNPTVNAASTATSPFISPRSGDERKIQNLNQEESFAVKYSCTTSPRNYAKRNFMTTATSPLTSPRRDACGILRKLSPDDINSRSEDFNKTYNLLAGHSDLNENRTFHNVDYTDLNAQPVQVAQNLDNVRVEEYQRPEAKWVEITETKKENRVEHQVKKKHHKSILQKSSSSRPGTPINYELYSIAKEPPSKPLDNQQLGMQNFLPTLLMTEVIKDNVRLAGGNVNVSNFAGYQEAAPVETVILEDSDMEFEIMERPHYTKYIKSKPMQDEMLRLSADDEDGGLAEFLEIENGMHDLDVRYLRNASPLSFTEITEDDPTVNINQMKIYINSKHQQSSIRSITNPTEISQTTFALSTPEICSARSETPTKEPKRRGKSIREQHLQKTFERLARGGRSRDTPPACPSNSIADQRQSARSYRPRTNYSSSPQAPRLTLGSYTERGGVHPTTKKDKPKNSGRRRVLPTSLKISKSIEDQKSEKTFIFQKMADIQTKIIEVLDKLRISLLELNVPKNVYEKSKRQKNALEFAVRFSRNFLYPLKGLLEELKFTPLEQFNSLSSNDACNRVCYIYNLLLQSLNTYQKQLRYFHLDHVPQKLPTLIEIIHTTTVLCLEKNIFSRHDERITFLQQSCNKFLDFLQELQDGHLNTARENYRKLTLEKASPRYELKMVMNPLNMYEPKLVPKVVTNSTTTTARKKTTNKPKRHITSIAIDETKDEIKEKPQDDQIPTHVQSYPVEAKSSDILQTDETHPLQLGSGDAVIPGLDKSVLQAMRHMTQQQVRTILEPILKQLSSALGHQNNPEMFEAICNAFNSKVFSPMEAEKQLSNDNKCSPAENQIAIEETAEMAPTTTPATFSRETALRSQAFDDLESTCKPLKVANRTKTQRQQNSRPTVATNRKHSANTITTTTVTKNVAAMATAAAAAVIVGDDDDEDDDDSPTDNHNISNNNDSNNNNNSNYYTNDHTKINTNMGLSSINNNMQNSTGPDWRANAGELTHKPQRGEITLNREERLKHKTFKLMNEEVNESALDEKLTNEDKKQQQRNQQITDTQPTHTNKSQIRTTKRAPKHDRDRLRRCRQQQRPLNKFPCSSSSSFSSESDDDEVNRQLRSQILTPVKQNDHSHPTTHPHTSNNNILTISKQGDLNLLHSSQQQRLLQTTTTTTAKRNLESSTSYRKKLSQQQKRKILQATTPPAPSVSPTSSRDYLFSSDTRNSDDNQEDQLLLRKMPLDLLKIQVPLTTSASSALMTGRQCDKPNVYDELDGQQPMEADGVNHKIVHSASFNDYGEMSKKHLTLYNHKSPYDNSPVNTPQRLRPLPEKEMRKLKPKPSKITSGTTELIHSIGKETQSSRKDKMETKSDLHIDEMIQERDRFLKLCEKNRFYKNPNFAEPWKIFSVISERLLSDILNTVETDFNDGVSKFVEDFLALETKTQ